MQTLRVVKLGLMFKDIELESADSVLQQKNTLKNMIG